MMAKITILDGGIGQELLKRSQFPAHPMWSAKVMLDEPAIVQETHEDFIRAGAEVITVNAYSVTPERLARDGNPELFAKLQARAIELANAAKAAVGRDVKIAGCLSPLSASYRPDLSPDFELNLKRYQEIVAQQAGKVDLIQCETMSSITEATAACAAAKQTDLPVWVGLSVADDTSQTLRSGEPLKDVLAALAPYEPDAVLLNCSIPEAITASLPLVIGAGFVSGAYANGFTSVATLKPGGTVDALTARTDLGPVEYARFAEGWAALGATIIGGCCEVGPAHIAELARRLG